MLSLCELKRASAILCRRLAGTRLDRVVQPDEHSLVLTFGDASRVVAGDLHVVLSCSPEFARLSVRESSPTTPPAPLSFGQFLRPRVARSRFSGADILGEDRQAVIHLASLDGEFQLLLSILGPRSNVYLLDADGIVLYSMRPFEETRRELDRGRAWSNPASVLKSAGSDRWAGVPDDRYLEEIERTYEELVRGREFEDLAAKVSNALGKEADALARKAANMQEDLKAAIEADEYKRKGELLKSALHTVRPGADSVAATEYETGVPVTIPLDPQLSPAANLELYFKRYQKELRGVSLIRRQLDNLHRLREEVENYQAALDALCRTGQDFARLREFASGQRVRKIMARYFPPARGTRKASLKIAGRKAVPGRLLPRRYKSTDGLEIWVGKSDEGNDFLTTRLAHGNDLFFHVEGASGSHVILRTGGRADPPPESVLDACELAVHFSRFKESRRADVHVAQVKNLRKPAGAKPGLVYVLRGRTIHLRRAAERLERVLASRIEE